MKQIIIAMTAIALCSSCNIKDNAKKAINKTGETVGKVGGEFAGGVADGVTQTFQSTLTISEDLQKQGLSSGKFTINEDTHTISIYLIFNKDISKTITAKVFDKEWAEYGRCNTEVAAKKGDAKFIDFRFDDRTDFEMNSNFVLE